MRVLLRECGTRCVMAVEGRLAIWKSVLWVLSRRRCCPVCIVIKLDAKGLAGNTECDTNSMKGAGRSYI